MIYLTPTRRPFAYSEIKTGRALLNARRNLVGPTWEGCNAKRRSSAVTWGKQSYEASGERSDFELLKSISAGSKPAMHTLYARHNLRVYRFVLRLIGDAWSAEDIVSEVFLDVWRQAGRFEGRSQVRT